LKRKRIKYKNKRMEVQLLMNTEKMMCDMLKENGRVIVEELSKKYGFSYDEGVEHVNLSKIDVKEKLKTGEKKLREGVPSQKIVLPFCGEKCDDNCDAIRLNHGLYTQCTNAGTEENDEYMLCKTCYKQTEKNSNGKPTYGYIDERVELGNSFRDPKGKEPVKYGNIMDKLKITRDEAIQEADKQGLIIPEDQFEIKKAQRGRPKKDTTAVDTSGSDDEPQKKTRGRPKKEKQVVNTNSGEDMIKELVNKAHSEEQEELLSEAKEKPKEKPNKEPKEEPSPDLADAESDDEDEDDEEELAVTEFKISGVKYLKSADNTLYDFTSHEEVGTWNPISKKIEIEDEDDDDD
jgi:hypothetical protein